MKSIWVNASWVVLLICFIFLPAVAADQQADAVKAAQSWLSLVDAGLYGQSWDQSAELFKAAITRKKWQETLTALRKPLGDVIFRRVKATQYTTSLPGAPDGEYLVIQFTTGYQNKKTAVETVTPMKDADGVWRVSGYFIK